MSGVADVIHALGLNDGAIWLAQIRSGGWVTPHLAEPAWLALWLLPLLLLLAQRRRRQTVLRYADAALQPWALVLSSPAHAGRRRWLRGLAWLFWLSLGLALADPRVPKATDEALQTRPPLMFLIDDSAAMSVADVSPNRLARAVTLVGLLAQQFPDRRLGLMVYADHAGLLLPPASDPSLLPFYLQQISALPHPLVVPNPAAAFNWIAHLKELHGGAVIWLTSAEAHSFQGAEGSQQLAAAEALKKSDIRLIALTMAAGGGPLIKEGLPMKTADGSVIESQPAPARVTELANITGGAAGITGTVPSDEHFIHAAVEALPNLPPKFALGDQTRSLRAVLLLLAWLAAIGLMIAALARRAPLLTRSASVLPLLFAGLTLAVGVSLPAPAQAQEAAGWFSQASNRAQITTGDAALAQGDYASAQAAFGSAKGFAARLGAGLAALRRADAVFAVNQLQMALTLATSADERALAAFNLGDALVLTGRYPDALAAFEFVLGQPEAPAALNNAAFLNRDLVRQILQTAAKNGKNSPKFQGHQIAKYGYAVDPATSKMDKEIQKADGVTAGLAGNASQSPPPSAVFVLNEADATSARSKLNLIHNQPAPLLDGLLRQQPYRTPVLSPEAPPTATSEGQP